MTARRRSPGEGGAYSYQTKAGERWYWKATITRTDGTRNPVVRRGFLTKKAALAAMRDALRDSDRGVFVEPSREPLGRYLATWLDGLRLEPSTVSHYRIIVRSHVIPYLADVPLASLTTVRIDALYRQLEQAGRRSSRTGKPTGEALSAATVRHVHTLLHAALAAAVDAGQLAVNPAAKAHPPTAKQARAREMTCWTAGQLGTFLDWAKEHTTYPELWHVMAMTGMRRGEALALRWRDLDLAAGTVTIRRAVQFVFHHGGTDEVREGPTKTGKPRVVDIDTATVSILRGYRRQRGSLALVLARDDALVFGDVQGRLRRPEHVSAAFRAAVARCRKTLGDETLPAIRLHDLRHSHATALLRAGRPVREVSERLGHASPATTLAVYAHVLPGDQRAAADLFAGLVEEGEQ